VNNRQINIGIVGSGAIVENFLNAVDAYDGIKVTTIYSRDIKGERINFLAEKYSIAFLYDDYENMLADKVIDFIYVAGPNSLHYIYSLKALQTGKNVICEKPFTSTKKEAETLFEAAKRNNKMIFEAIVNIHMPNFKLIRELLGELGRIKAAQLNYSQYSGRYDKFRAGESPNVFNPEFSGGALMDINIYNIHFMMRLFGEPDKFKYYPNIERGVDTSGLMVMEYPNFFASLTGAKDAESDNFVIIQGEDATLYVGNGANGCEYLELKRVKGGRSIKYNLQYQTNTLYYEIGEFMRIFNQWDYDAFKQLCEYSIGVMGLVEGARKEAGIIFAADNKEEII